MAGEHQTGALALCDDCGREVPKDQLEPMTFSWVSVPDDGRSEYVETAKVCGECADRWCGRG